VQAGIVSQVMDSKEAGAMIDPAQPGLKKHRMKRSYVYANRCHYYRCWFCWIIGVFWFHLVSSASNSGKDTRAKVVERSLMA